MLIFFVLKFAEQACRHFAMEYFFRRPSDIIIAGREKYQENCLRQVTFVSLAGRRFMGSILGIQILETLIFALSLLVCHKYNTENVGTVAKIMCLFPSLIDIIVIVLLPIVAIFWLFLV